MTTKVEAKITRTDTTLNPEILGIVADAAKPGQTYQETSEDIEHLEHKLSFLARAITENEEIKVCVTKGDCSCNMNTHEIYLPFDKDFEVMRGHLMHECAHILFSKLLSDDEEKLAEKIQEEMQAAGLHEPGHPGRYRYTRQQVKRMLHDQLNSLEDYRVERAMGLFFEDADYSIWWAHRNFVSGQLQEMPVGEILKSPAYALHLSLCKLDATALIPQKEYRKAIRETAKWLATTKFAEADSTAELLPIAVDTLRRLLPFYPTDNPDDLKPPPASGTASANPKHEKISGKTKGAAKAPAPKSVKEAAEALESAVKEAASKGRPLEIEMEHFKPYELEQNYVRPQRPDVRKLHHGFYEERTTPLEKTDWSITEGRRLGRELLRRLRMAETRKPRLKRGALDVRVVKRMFAKAGALTSPRIFYRDPRLKHDHTVGVLIDFSGSMTGQPLATAKQAALMLSSALEEMNVLHSIRGFSAIGGRCEIVDYVLKDWNDRRMALPRLSGAQYLQDPNACQNRDSDSIRAMTRGIKAQGSGRKIIFVISDGQPHHPDGVSGLQNFNRNAFADTYWAVEEAEKQGVRVIGVAITPEAAMAIQKTYRSGFHVEKLEDLPRQLLQVYMEASFRE